MLIDLHQDLHRHQRFPDRYPVRDQTSINQLKAVDARVVFTTGELSTDELAEDQVGRQINYYQSCSGWQIIKNKDELGQCIQGSSRGFIYHIEGLRALDQYDMETVINYLENFYNRGLRSLSLTHTADTSFAGGNEGEAKLTDRGQVVLDWCRDHGVIVDLAHLNEESFYQVADYNNSSVLVTHANARQLADTGKQRNLTDQQLKTVADSGGLLGLMLSRNYIKVDRHVVIDDVMRQIDYLSSILGEDQLALGTDFGGCLHEVAIVGLERMTDLIYLQSEVEKKFGSVFTNNLFYLNASTWLSNNFSN